MKHLNSMGREDVILNRVLCGMTSRKRVEGTWWLGTVGKKQGCSGAGQENGLKGMECDIICWKGRCGRTRQWDRKRQDLMVG
jgi:hypothetical protein